MGGGIGVQQVRSVQSLQKLSAEVEQCGAPSDGKAEPNELEQSSKRGGRSAQLKANRYLSETEALLPRVLGAR
jgi:hypothetical protein